MTTRDTRYRSCVPHSPVLLEAIDESIYVARCLKCGLWGPEQEDSLQAKMA